MEILFTLDGNGSSIEFDPSVPCIIVRWVGFSTFEEHKKILEMALDLYNQKKEEFGKLTWVADLTKLDVFTEDGMLWTANVWNLKAYQCGLAHMAIIIDKEEYSMHEMNTETYMSESEVNTNLEITIRVFQEEVAAKDWLKASLE